MYLRQVEDMRLKIDSEIEAVKYIILPESGYRRIHATPATMISYSDPL